MSRHGLPLILQAADFAARVHVNQRRKGTLQEPYINHLIEVAVLLANATEGGDADLIAAGFLHDTLEDTPTEYEELAAIFGSDIAQIVAEVTDDKSFPKLKRKRLQIETVAQKSVRARLLKIADKTSNVRSLVSSPPADWGAERALEYIDWATRVVDGCRGLNLNLEAQFDAATADARAAIEDGGR